MPSPQLTSKGQAPKVSQDICVFAQTNFRNQVRRFGIKTDDRRRHMYVIGKTGMGKTTIMENMVLSDIYAGHGVGLVDPHGDFAEKIIDHIPSWRLNDVVYLNPADVENPIGFNILEVKTEEQKHLVAAGLMGTFKKIWPDVWSSRMEYILNNTLLALLDYPGSTLLGVNRLLSDKEYRKRVVRHLKDPVIKAFWRDEFANYDDRYAKEAVAPIQNKIGQFLSASIIRNMVAQVKSTINVREIMDTRKIFIMNLSKGRIGEDNSRLLGGMLITKLQLAAMERVDTPENDRKDFFLYVDEFQNFATPSFANILSEARKYRLSLIMAHQYVAQLDEVVANAVFGNVGTIVTFRVGGADAEMLVKEFTPTFTEEDIVNLTKYQIILKLMIDGVASQPFSAATLPPLASSTKSSEKVVRVSQERYGRKKEVVEEKISRWSQSTNDEEDQGIEGVRSTSSAPVQNTTQRTQMNNAPVRKEDRRVVFDQKKKNDEPKSQNQKRFEQHQKNVAESAQRVVEKTMPAGEPAVTSRNQDQRAEQPRMNTSTSPRSSVPHVVSQSVPAGTSELPLPGEGKRKRRRKRKKRNGGEGVISHTPAQPAESPSHRPFATAFAGLQTQVQTPPVVAEKTNDAPIVTPPSTKSVPSSIDRAPKDLLEDEEISFDDLT